MIIEVVLLYFISLVFLFNVTKPYYLIRFIFLVIDIIVCLCVLLAIVP